MLPPPFIVFTHFAIWNRFLKSSWKDGGTKKNVWSNPPNPQCENMEKVDLSSFDLAVLFHYKVGLVARLSCVKWLNQCHAEHWSGGRAIWRPEQNQLGSMLKTRWYYTCHLYHILWLHSLFNRHLPFTSRGLDSGERFGLGLTESRAGWWCIV